jgi:cytoskeletal protein RodZ
MISGFSKKKIKSEKTLGELLKSTRQKKEITLEDAETVTKVKLKYLKALEENNWDILPLDVYTRGFILSYSKLLNIKKDEVLSLFETEALLHRRRQNSELSYNRSFRDIKFLITPKLLAYSALSLFVLTMVGYIVFQITSFAGLPSLEIITPANNIVVDQDSIDMSGLTDPDAIVKVNDENVPVTQEGRFISTLRLHRGVNVLKVKAINKTKKETSEVFTVEYKPKTAQAAELTASQ